MLFSEMDKVQLNKLHEELKNEYENIKGLKLKLNMSRGVPSVEQLNLSQKMLDVINSDSNCTSENGTE